MKMDDMTNLCLICKKPKKSNASASITQWISTCVCDMASQENLDQADYEVCEYCGKRIGEARKGSFTQFIFRPEFCSCQRPKSSIKAEFDFYQAPSSESDDDDDRFSEELVIEMDRAKFPVDRYKPFRLLGEGSGGSVYLCRDLLLSKNVAVKTLHTIQDSQLLAFQEEAKATSKLNHPSIIQVYDFGITEGQVPYMVLEYFKGESLSDFLKARGALDWRLAFAIAEEICSALSYSHGFEIFHRDIKPGNILIRLDADGFPRIKVIDFGLALVGGRESATVLETCAGTPAYMSPDQLRGLEYDSRSEIYSLGCVLFELLTGSVPYEGSDAIDLVNRHMNTETPRAIDFCSVPEPVSQIVCQAMAKEAEDRFQDFEQFRQAFDIRRLEKDSTEFGSRQENTEQITRSGATRLTPIMMASFLVAASVGVYFACVNRSFSGSGKSSVVKVKKVLFSDRFAVVKSTSSNFLKVAPKGEITDSDLKLVQRELSSSRRPISLNIEGQKIDGSGLKYLAQVPVYRINSSLCKVKQRYARDYTAIKSLDRLMTEEANITDQFVLDFDPETSISSLDLAYNPIADRSLEHISRFKNLEKLDIRYTQVSDKGLKALSRAKGLISLLVSNNKNVTGSGFLYMSQLPHLQLVELENCPELDKIALRSLGKFPALNSLKMGGKSKIKPEDILLLNKSNSLVSLSLLNLRPAKKYAPYLAKLKSIQNLVIEVSDMDDSDLETVVSMPRLRQISIREAPDLTKEGVESARARISNRVNFEIELPITSPRSKAVEVLIIDGKER